MQFNKEQFWKPSSQSRSQAVQNLQQLSFRESEAEGGHVYVHNPHQQYSLSQQRQSLPVYNYSLYNSYEFMCIKKVVFN